jgi:hypothetical protein
VIDLKDCKLRRYNAGVAATFEKFDCGKEDVNKFFYEDNDYYKYEKQRQARLFCRRPDLCSDILAVCTL